MALLVCFIEVFVKTREKKGFGSAVGAKFIGKAAKYAISRQTLQEP